MKVEKDGKTLYHVQSITDWRDDAYDMFVYASSESEVNSNLERLYRDDYGDIDETELRDLVDNSNIYTLYAETI